MINTPVEADGLVETLDALKGLDADMRRQANGELRRAAGDSARQIVQHLKAAAASGPPVASRVARTVRVKNDRIPSVQIGGARKVGRSGAPASALLWGSEHGSRGDVDRFAAPLKTSGYWIAPTVAGSGTQAATREYKQALVDIFKRYRLL